MSTVKTTCSSILPISLGLFLLFMVSCTSTPVTETPLAWTPLPAQTGTPKPTTVESLPQTTSISESIFCLDGASFLEDLTLPDGSLIDPGVEIDKRWLVQNTGSCDWGSGYRLVHIGVDPFVGKEEIALYPASSGSDAVWRVVLVAPNSPGDYVSRWQAHNADGEPFGDEVYLLVIVPTPTRTPTVTLTATP